MDYRAGNTQFFRIVKGEVHSKMTLKGMKEDLETNISPILVFKIDSPVIRNKQLKSEPCTPWS